jgi:mitochondrial fission protein ELM1
VSDGRRGIENQALGLAEAVARLTPLTIERRIAPRTSGVVAELTRAFKQSDPAALGAAPGEPCASREPPDLWIACGRASLPYSIAARRWSEGKTFVVQVQDPGRPARLFDLVVPPTHDGLEGDNVVPVLGAPNRITHDALAAALETWESKLPPAPRAAVLVGGDSKRHSLTPALVRELLNTLGELRKDDVSLMISTSRRTPDEAVAALRERFAGDEGAIVWTGDRDGPNPYLAFLAAADAVLVTKDSTNMLTDAATAGKPVLMLPVEGRDGKFERLYAELEARGLARPFQGRLETWPVEPLRETDRAAQELVKRWKG